MYEAFRANCYASLLMQPPATSPPSVCLHPPQPPRCEAVDVHDYASLLAQLLADVQQQDQDSGLFQRWVHGA